MTWEPPSTRQIIAAAWWVRSGCTTDVARGLIGATVLQWDAWIDRGRIELERRDPTPCALLVMKIELADALRRGEVLRRVHSYALKDPARLLDYLSRRWPDAFADAALALGASSSTAPASSLVDHVLDATALEDAEAVETSVARESVAEREGDGGVVGDELAHAHDGQGPTPRG